MGMTMTQTQATALAETSLLCPKTLSEGRTRLINELVKGKELTTQLQILLDEPSGHNGSFSAPQIVGKILRSFTETISVLSCDNSNNKNKTESSVLCEESLPSSDDIGSENSIQSKKRLRSKIGRGCYKRSRKSCQSWITVCPTLDDGHAWRKYGQKDILNATYPRCYFRCTHKFDQGCQATKQVQKMEDDPKMYQTTYIGVHTCKEINNSPQMIRDPESWEPYIINTSEAKPLIFGDKQQEVMSFTSSTTVKMEQKEETKAGDNFTVKKEQKQETTKYNLGDPKGTLNDEHDGDSIWKDDLTGFGSPESIFMPSKAENFLENDTNFNMDSNNNSDYYYYPCVADDSSNSYLADSFLRFESIGEGDIQFGGCEFS